MINPKMSIENFLSIVNNELHPVNSNAKSVSKKINIYYITILNIYI